MLPVVARPQLHAVIFGYFLLPLPAIALAVVCFIDWQAAMIVAFFAVPLLGVWLILLSGPHTFRIDAVGIHLVGIAAWRRFTIRWDEIEEVGLVELERSRTPVLTVRPRAPYQRSPWGAYQWDPERNLLLVAGVEKWTVAPREIVAAVRHASGTKWTDQLDLGRYAKGSH